MTNSSIDLNGINGSIDAAAQGIEFGDLLMAFAGAVAGSDADLSGCRQALQKAAGADVLIDAAGVAANFQRMVRIADAIGIPVDDMDSELGQGVREELGLARFATARNTFDAVPVD